MKKVPGFQFIQSDLAVDLLYFKGIRIMFSAFLTGIRMKQSEIAEIVAEVDTEGVGELRIAEFLQIMTHTMHRLANEESGARQPTVRLLAMIARISVMISILSSICFVISRPLKGI